MNKLRVSLAMSLIALMGVCSVNTQAAAFGYNGEVQMATGALVGLITPIPQDMTGTIAFDDAAIAGGLAGPADVTAMQVNIGTVCIALDVGTCAGGTIATPITSVDAAAATFAGGLPTGGSMTVTGELTTPIALTLSVVFDLSAGTWSADAGLFGTVNGTFAPTPPRIIDFDPNRVPTLPVYGLILTGLGLLLVAGKRLRAV